MSLLGKDSLDPEGLCGQTEDVTQRGPSLTQDSRTEFPPASLNTSQIQLVEFQHQPGNKGRGVRINGRCVSDHQVEIKVIEKIFIFFRAVHLWMRLSLVTVAQTHVKDCQPGSSPCGSVVETLGSQCTGLGFDPWSGN